MIHAMEVRIPGSFVVLQGLPGDGRSNTMDRLPRVSARLPEPLHVRQPAELSPRAGWQNWSSSMGGSPSIVLGGLLSPPPTSQLPGRPHKQPLARLVTDAMDEDEAPLQLESSIVTDDGAVQSASGGAEQGSLHPAVEHILHEWKNDCRQYEVHQQADWYESCSCPHLVQNNKTCKIYGLDSQWWLTRNGNLALLDHIPTRSSITSLGSMSNGLAPGTTVVASSLITLCSTTLNPINIVGETVHDVTTFPCARDGWIQLLTLASPIRANVVLSVDGYSFMGPGLPATYLQPELWWWRVTCPVGAYVREGEWQRLVFHECLNIVHCI
jgi:hypothetical protein